MQLQATHEKQQKREINIQTKKVTEENSLTTAASGTQERRTWTCLGRRRGGSSSKKARTSVTGPASASRRLLTLTSMNKLLGFRENTNKGKGKKIY